MTSWSPMSLVEYRGLPSADFGDFEDVHLLRRHVALDQQKALFSRGLVGGHVGDQHGMPGNPPLMNTSPMAMSAMATGLSSRSSEYVPA